MELLYSGTTSSACGTANAAIGPFYCAADRKIYLDLQFFDDLQSKYRAPGDASMAYVVAHEVGHHAQNLLGLLGKSHQEMSAAPNSVIANNISVKVELQADCYSGVWAYHAGRMFSIFETNDLVEASNAAAAVGDDTLQKLAGFKVVMLDKFTHGSASDRSKWLNVGIATGNMDSCTSYK